MRSLIVYYSQTGNTKKIARAIHKGMSQVLEQCDIASIKEVKPQDLNKYDLIGLGSPVWDGGETPNVRRFIENLPKQQGKHIFSFNTHGVMPEHFFPTVVRRLKGKGFTVIGMRDWYGDVFFQMAAYPYYTHGHPDEIDLKEAEDFGREMAEASQRISAGETDLIPPVPDHVLTPQLLVLTEFYRSGHNPHGRIQYDPEKCIYPKCRLCMDHCLMDYIDLSASPRVFGSNKTECDMWLGCTFCEMICPTGAIFCDWEQFQKDFGEKIGVILGGDPLAKAAEEAIASGRLRMLVPKKEMKPYFLVHNKHPRFKIPKEK
jgi:flavodoxin/formate hydrogenlyase subunit 6/NADH:ubiquinone oxidoreductase subunit I